MENAKSFEAVWGDSFVVPGCRMIGTDFVSADNGYSNEERDLIDRLEVGQTWQCPDYYDHTIKRVA